MKWRIEFEERNGCPADDGCDCHVKDIVCPGTIGDPGCPAVKVEGCKWAEIPTEDENDYKLLRTECSQQTMAGMKSTGYKYCPYCGREIEVVK